MNKIKTLFIFYKISHLRTASYMNMMMLTVIIFKQFNIPWRWFPLGLLVVPIVTLAIGYFDYKLGFHAEQLEQTALRNPITHEVLGILRRLDNERELECQTSQLNGKENTSENIDNDTTTE